MHFEAFRRMSDANHLIAEITRLSPDSAPSGSFVDASGTLGWSAPEGGGWGASSPFVQDLRGWIETGDPVPLLHRHPGPRLRWDKAAELDELACEMRLVQWEDEAGAAWDMQGDDGQRPQMSEFRLGKLGSGWTVVAEWPTEDGMDRRCVAWGPSPDRPLAEDAVEHFRSLPEIGRDMAAPAFRP